MYYLPFKPLKGREEKEGGESEAACVMSRRLSGSLFFTFLNHLDEVIKS